MIIAGDIGGTKARIGLFRRVGTKLELVVSKRYASVEHGNLESIVSTFLSDHAEQVKEHPTAACFGLPGPVVAGRVKVTNLPWEVVQADLSSALGIPKVKLVNDLVSTAAAIPSLGEDSLASIYVAKGPVDTNGRSVVVAPGTGLGQALIHHEEGRIVCLPSEGGHANFAPTNEEEIDLLRYLQGKLGHVSTESILCGPGLVNIYSFLRDTNRGIENSRVREAFARGDDAAVIATNAIAGTDELCSKALDIFCYALGAHSSNMMLTFLATAGVYLGGGIPPKVLPALKGEAFQRGYLRKGKCLDKVEATPVFVILDDTASLYGAAALAGNL